jgi:serine/threonine protein kinase
MAPEILQYRRYGFPVDIWSLGVVLHQMVVGKRPFGNPYISTFNQMFDEIKRTKLTFAGAQISDSLKDLMRRMLTIDVK